MVLFPTNDALVKLATTELPTAEIMALRGLILVPVMGAALVTRGQTRQMGLMLSPRILLRSGCDVISTLTFITALAVVPLGTLTAILLTAPLILTAASALIFKEDVGWRRWSAVAVGFAGMLLVVKPTPSEFNGYTLLALLATLSSVTRDLLTRGLDRSAPGMVVTCASLLTVGLAGVALSIGDTLVLPSAKVAVLILVASLLNGIASYAIILAFRTSELSAIAPFRYSVILWAMLLGYLIWGDLPDRASAIGIAIIIGSGLYVAHREHIRAREARALQAAQPTKDRVTTTAGTDSMADTPAGR